MVQIRMQMLVREILMMNDPEVVINGHFYERQMNYTASSNLQ